MNQGYRGEKVSETDGGALMGSNQARSRAYNERLVITLLHRHGALSRAEIAARTGLSAQGVSQITRKLEAEGLIAGGARLRGRVGQPSIPLALNPDGASFIGVKIGRRSTEVVRGDMAGEIRDSLVRGYTHPDPRLVGDFVLDAVAQIIARSEGRPATAIGIAIPSQMWDWAGLLGLPADRMAGWRDLHLAERIAAATSLPVYTRNDATAACGAELMFGSAPVPADFLHIYFGHFIGGGLVLDGRLFDGPTGNAGAIGSIPIEWQGQPRQLIELASINVLEQWQGGGRSLGAEGFWDIAPALLDRWLTQAAASSAQAITASCAVLDLGTVVIDGWLPDPIRAEMTRRIAEALLRFDFSGLTPPEVIEGSLGPRARTIGAVAIPFGAHFLVDQTPLTAARPAADTAPA